MIRPLAREVQERQKSSTVEPKSAKLNLFENFDRVNGRLDFNQLDCKTLKFDLNLCLTTCETAPLDKVDDKVA